MQRIAAFVLILSVKQSVSHSISKQYSSVRKLRRESSELPPTSEAQGLLVQTDADLELHRHRSWQNHEKYSSKVFTRAVRDGRRRSSDVVGSANRKSLLQGCGVVCDTTASTNSYKQKATGKYTDLWRKRVDCVQLFQNRHNDAAASSWPPPNISKIPQIMLDDYKMGGNLKIHDWYFLARYSGGNASEPEWTQEHVNSFISDARQGNPKGAYGAGQALRLLALLQRHADTIRGKSFFVIGSIKPWVEAMLLTVGAAHVTTIEYGRIISKDSRISTMTPDEVRQKFLRSGGAEPHFDGGVTYSSLEHAGLGRYGDALNPWGDLQAMAKAWCITKPRGRMFLGVPTFRVDSLNWNAHRVYGPQRYPHFVANWAQLDKEPQEGMLLGGEEDQQPVVLERIDSL